MRAHTHKAHTMAQIKATAIIEFMAADKHGGFGYFGHSVRRPEVWAREARPYSVPEILDYALIQRANYLGLTWAQLAEFCDSKAGRWAGDAIEGGFLDVAVPTLQDALTEYAAAEFNVTLKK